MRVLGIVLVFSVVLSACGGGVNVNQPPPAFILDATSNLAKSELVSRTDHTRMYLNEEGNVIYQQMQGGGGATLFFLTGPVGLLANQMMIESNTKNDVALIAKQLSFDPVSLFSMSAKTNGLKLTAENNHSIKLTPYILVSKTGNDEIIFASALLAKYDALNEEWLGHYFYQLPQKYQKEKIGRGLSEQELQGLRKSFEKGFNDVLDIHIAHKNSGLPVQKEISFTSWLMTPRFLYSYPGGLLLNNEPGRTNIRINNVIYSFPNEEIEITG